MLDGNAIKRIERIITADTGMDCRSIDPATSIRDQVSLDSMQFIGLIAKVEIEFGIELPLSVMQVTTLNEFYDQIAPIIASGNAEE